MAYRIDLVSSSNGEQGNWASQCRGTVHPTREAAQAAIAADDTAQPDAYGNTCKLAIVEVPAYRFTTDGASGLVEATDAEEAVERLIADGEWHDGAEEDGAWLGVAREAGDFAGWDLVIGNMP